ncbi:MAG: tetratricopeptide repeat protein [Chloroflexota bacterium]
MSCLSSYPYQTFVAVHDFLVALARRQPLVLVFEDLHWADDLSLDLISLLMEAVPSNPILLLCVYRPHYEHKGSRFSAIASRKCPDHYMEFSLRELTHEQSRSLIKSLLGVKALPPAISEPVLKQTGGHPFFMEEAIRALIEAGILYLDSSQAANNRRWLVRDGLDSALGVPESVQSVILSRVDRLEPTLKQVLRAAAVIGYNFPTQILAQIVPPEVDLKKMLWSLEETVLIYREKVVPEEEYAFKHVLTQESVYQTIPPQQRTRLHRQVAEAMEQRYQASLSQFYAQLAYHYNRGQLAEKAVAYFCQAGEKSRRAYLYADAIYYFKQTLKQLEEIPAHPPARANLNQWQLTALAGLSQIYHRQGKETQAQDYLRQAIALGQESRVDKPTLIRLYHLLSEVYHWQGRFEEQATVGQAGLALLGPDETETVEAALMNQAIAIARYKQGHLAQFYALTDQTARFIQNLPYLEELRPAYFHIAISLYYRKRLDQVAQWFRVVEGWAKRHDDQRVLAEIYDYELGYRLENGDLRTAINQAKPVLELYRKIGADRRQWRCLEDLAWACILIGDFSTATQYAEQAIGVAEALGFDAYRAASQLNMGMVWLCQQSWKKAATALRKAGQFHTEGIFLWIEWVAHYCLGQIYRIQGRHQAALSQFQRALELFQPCDVPFGWWLYRWPLLTCILSGLEAMVERVSGDSNDFKAYCHQFESLKEQPALAPLPQQWYLEATDGVQFQPTSETPGFSDSFGQSLGPEWDWQDPFADCSLRVQHGLEIQAANGRDLWHLNLSAPRLLRPAAGDFTIQTVCRAVDSELSRNQKPAMGGLLVWKDQHNFLRLVWGYWGKQEITFEGCIDNENIIVGRGLLPRSSVKALSQTECLSSLPSFYV